MHETGLRILIRKVQLIGMQYDKALIPVFSYFKDHYFRIFFNCIKGKKDCDEIVKNHGIFNEAGPLWLGQLFDKVLVKKINSIISDKKVNKKSTLKDIKNNNSNNKIIKLMDLDSELLNFLKIINNESKIDVPGFFDIHEIAKEKKSNKIIKKEKLLQLIKKRKFKVAETHFSGTGIRTNMPYKNFKKLI